MNKTFFTFFLFLTSWGFYSQNSKNYCGELTYKLTTNFAYPHTTEFKMIFNDSISFSSELNVIDKEAKYEKEISERGQTNKIIAGRKIITPIFFLNKKNDFYFSDITEDNYLVVKEDYFDWNWKIHEDLKFIGSFECQKATIHFRGHDYVAWFTNSIPVPFGLWKFKGLSGLILEVNDTKGKVSITTENIQLMSNKMCSFNYNPEILKKSLTIKEFLKKQNEIMKDFFKKLSSKLPKEAPPLVLDEDCEDCKDEMLEIFVK